MRELGVSVYLFMIATLPSSLIPERLHSCDAECYQFKQIWL
uniref:Uncharacterized protein n=1 Tax=Arundo donax TaxID=35708 RepID=A0A0A9F064_ARUDO